MAFKSIIKLNPDTNILMMKHPIEDYNNNSELIVDVDQWAYVYRNGVPEEPYTKPGKYILKSDNNFFTNPFKRMFRGGEMANHNEIYFVNIGRRFSNIDWTVGGTQLYIENFKNYFAFDASGIFSFEIKDPLKLKKEMPENDRSPYISRGDIQIRFGKIICSQIRPILANAVRSGEMTFGYMESHMIDASNKAFESIRNSFDDLGLKLTLLEFSSIGLADEAKGIFDEHRGILTERGRQVALGYNYFTGQLLDALKLQASNSASGGMANLGAGMGMGMAAGQIYSGIESNLTDISGGETTKNEEMDMNYGLPSDKRSNKTDY